jgi:hypothetical protein
MVQASLPYDKGQLETFFPILIWQKMCCCTPEKKAAATLQRIPVGAGDSRLVMGMRHNTTPCEDAFLRFVILSLQPQRTHQHTVRLCFDPVTLSSHSRHSKNFVEQASALYRSSSWQCLSHLEPRSLRCGATLSQLASDRL